MIVEIPNTQVACVALSVSEEEGGFSDEGEVG